jgi:Fe-S cluster biosynthesis and repair protein YggX
MGEDLTKRIEQFQKMSEADPNNELGHFSLGKAYLEAGRHTEAATSLSRALALNPSLSKTYQLLGEVWIGAGDRAKAIDVLSRGVQVADEQGDRAPLMAMTAMLKNLGASVPALKSAQAVRPPHEATGAAGIGFRCTRCGRPGGQLERPPFKGEVGERIARRICRDCWREWIAMGTKVINELGLVLSRPEAQATYDQYMIEFLQLEE